MATAVLPTSGPALAGPARLGGLIVGVGLLALICVASIALGTKSIVLPDVWHALGGGPGTDAAIVRQLRVPRTVLGVLVGVALGVSGALICAVTRNPLADTQILGINSGAGLAVVSAVSLLGLTSLWSYIWFAFLGAAVVMVVVYLLGSARRGGATPLTLTLAGVAIGAVLDGISTGIRLTDPRAFDSLRFWDVGTIASRPLTVSWAIAGFVVMGLILAAGVSSSLNAMALGDDVAVSLGVHVWRIRVCTAIAVTLLAGAATAAAGPIGFVGLMVAHAARTIAGTDWRWVLAYCAVGGAIIVLAADVLGRFVIRPGELQTGIVTAFIGAPVLIWLVRRERAT